LQNGDISKAGRNGAEPDGWAKIIPWSNNSNIEWNQGSGADDDFLEINRASAEDPLCGYYTVVSRLSNLQSYILEGYAWRSYGTERPRIIVYGSTDEAILVAPSSDPENVKEYYTQVPLDVYVEGGTGDQIVTGLLRKPLYTYDLDGVDAMSAGEAEDTWEKFRIPFTIPEPLARFAILLTTTGVTDGTGDACEIRYRDLRLIPAGPEIEGVETTQSTSGGGVFSNDIYGSGMNDIYNGYN